MLSRVGRVLGWTGDTIGALLLTIGLARYFHIYDWMAAKLTGSTAVYDPVTIAQIEFWVDHHIEKMEDMSKEMTSLFHNAEATARQVELEKLFPMLAAGVMIFLIGRALRYIFAGSNRKLREES